MSWSDGVHPKGCDCITVCVQLSFRGFNSVFLARGQTNCLLTASSLYAKIWKPKLNLARYSYKVQASPHGLGK